MLESEQVIRADAIAFSLQVRASLMLRDDYFGSVASAGDVELVAVADSIDCFVFGEALLGTGVGDTTEVRDALVRRMLRRAGYVPLHSRWSFWIALQ
jgi:hypothetical protein